MTVKNPLLLLKLAAKKNSHAYFLLTRRSKNALSACIHYKHTKPASLKKLVFLCYD
jgi:hypothetical protein